MGDRATLHINKVIPFSIWLASKGWQLQICKGDYEILRMTKDGEAALLVHAKSDAKKHTSMHGQSEKWFWKWKRERQQANASPVALKPDDSNCFGCASFGGNGIGSYRCRKCREYTMWNGKYDPKFLRMDRLEEPDEC